LKIKKKLKNDIKNILLESGVDKCLLEKCLTRLVNYAYRIRTTALDGGTEQEIRS
jgi:hypothetical protein